MTFEIDPTAPEQIVRRDFLKHLSAAGAAALMSGTPRLLTANEAEPVKQPEATADSCILLWMGGGMAAPDTFDPKRYLPFKKGLKVADMLSTFP
ncbi:MAG: twin-arginine translocation signal domain-containing protein, partial [Gimesia chilikensis]